MIIWSLMRNSLGALLPKGLVSELSSWGGDLTGRVGGAKPASKSSTLIHVLVAGASHSDDVDMLRAGSHRSLSSSILLIALALKLRALL